MKTYLTVPLFFLTILCLHVSIFAQENVENQTHPTIENPSYDGNLLPDEQRIEHESRRDLDGEMPVESWPEHTHTDKEPEDFQAKFFHMLFILGLLIGFMLLASWALKRMMKTRVTQMNTASNIKVLETRYLSPRATLYLVEVEDQTFLIAESPTSVAYLATLSQEEGRPVTSQSVSSPPLFSPRNS